MSVSRDLRLREVLQRIVGYACELVSARQGALGVAGPGERLTDFVAVGIDRAELDALTRDSPASGAPGPRPYLGVPLTIREELFGTLYVADKDGPDGFTDEDEETLVALATAAGIAVENARMYERSRQRERWLQASNEITAALLAETHPSGELKLVTARARAVAGTPVAAIALPDPMDRTRLVFEVIEGPDPTDSNLAGTTVDVATSASGMVFSSGQPLLIDQYGDAAANWQDEHNGGAPPRLREVGAAAIVPLAAGDDVLGVLLVMKLRGEPPFGDADLELLQNFAAHAALALQYAKAKADQRRLAVFEDRDRIAKEMQDLVIRRLFDIGLGLQGLSRLVQPVLRRRIGNLVDDLDRTIRDLRRSIFSLREEADPERELPTNLCASVWHLVADASDALGFEPTVTLDQNLDTVVPERVQSDLLATLREALSNVARHAHAAEVSVRLRAGGGAVTLEVLDDGIGVPVVRERNSGLANLGRRAQRWGGSLTVEPRAGAGGTRLLWTIPLAGI